MDNKNTLSDGKKLEQQVLPKIDLRVLGKKPYSKELFRKSVSRLFSNKEG